ncbi:clathrin light chain A-like isoform X1 [Dreissena polymorpha]|uniref:clathrin light chain A-like isoform X1 n=1 Tax=Dreissena polymorpha TaxID=45954 RepID=UPI002264AB9F|nr:clathrin light chain A-like isoform X1 [Dreissena polymorpha]
MADFDAFESAPQDDPAADFLAREQDELKGLDDDNFGGNANGDYDPFGGSSEQPTQSGYSFGQDDIGAAPQQYDDYGQHVQTDNYYNEETEDTGYSAISQVDRMRAEPEKIRIWREENTRRIEKKDGEEKKRIEEWRTIAKKELDDWYKHHDEQLNKTKENNRESEAAFIADRDETQPGEEWEKICRLCEFNPKNSKNTKDISRFRSILLQLKQTPLVR